MKYYYLAASLPSLALGEDPPVSGGRFDELCREHLCPADLRALEEMKTAFEQEPSHGVVREWRNSETRLRNAAVTQRASRLRREAEPHLREQAGADLYTEKEATDAFARPNPLEREMALDRVRWRHADELAGYDPFDTRAILAYAIKLRLAERWAAMSDEEGSKKTEEIVNQTTNEEKTTMETT